MQSTTNKLEEYRNKIAGDFPELTIKSLKIIGSGWHHDAVEINSGLVFRIPKGIHEKDSTTEHEISILKAMKGKLAVQIPEPLYISPDREYFGYPKLEGVLLDVLIKEFDENDWKQLKVDWVDIASTIHASLPIDQAQKFGLPQFINPASHSNAAESIFELEGVDQDILDFATKNIELFKKLDLNSINDTFIHNDLQFHNILADPKTKRISGLIDWTDACVGPISREFAVHEWWEKPGLLEEVTTLYEKQTGVHVDVAQVRLWRNLEELGDVVELSKVGNTGKARQRLNSIRELMKLESS